MFQRRSPPARSALHSGQSREYMALAAVALALILGAWLRVHGLGEQIVQDDEWHALHKLASAGYGEIFRSFGFADHSIPLTLFYKAMADTVGLDEINLRSVQVACGVALIALAAALAWRATASAPVAILLAFLLAGAPFLVLYSRFARPYAITTLLTVIILAGIWRWHERRSRGWAVAICVLCALAAWLHPLAALFPMAAFAFMLVADRRRGTTLALGAAAGAAIVLPLAVPLASDFASLTAKAGHGVPDAYTLWRVASLFAGGLPDAATAILVAIAAFGAWSFQRAHRELGAYLAFVALVPVLAVIVLGGSWTHQGHTFARYVFPVQVVFLFWIAFGTIALLELCTRNVAAQLACVALLVAAYLAANPAIGQVQRLGPWYGHLYHHFDYGPEHNRAARYYIGWRVPRFYSTLAQAPAGSVPIIEAPFNFDAPWNPLAFYALLHHQPERVGFLHDLCLEGPRYGELPRDARFRFRQFVALDDPKAVRETGARYLLFQRERLHGEPFARSDACLAALKGLYGEPVDIDGELAVFDLKAPRGSPKLQ